MSVLGLLGIWAAVVIVVLPVMLDIWLRAARARIRRRARKRHGIVKPYGQRRLP